MAVFAHLGRSPVGRLVALAVGAHLPYLAAVLLLWRSGIRRSWPVLAVAIVLRLAMVVAPPTFSDDIHRYVWDGRVGLSGVSPFRYAPDDPALAHLRDGGWEQINHRELRTIYPPASQLWFAATAAVCPAPVGFKVLAAAADLGVVWLVILLARRRARGTVSRGRDPAAVGVVAGAVYGWSPLACVETGMSGHLEPLAVLPLLLGLLWVGRARACGASSRGVKWRWGIGAGIGLGLACGTKLVPALLVPPLGRWDRRIWLVAPLVIAALYLPFIGAGQHLVETLDTFARRWEGNGSLFALIRAGAEGAVGWLGGAEGADQLVHLPFLDGVAAALQDTFFSLHKDGGFDAARPGAWPASDLALVVAKIACGALLLGLIVHCTARRSGPVTTAYRVLGLLLVLLPVAHPWYLLWVLPLAAVRGGWPWLWLAATMPLAYLPLERWWGEGVWIAPLWIQLVEYVPFFVVLVTVTYRTNRGGHDAMVVPTAEDRPDAVDPSA